MHYDFKKEKEGRVWTLQMSLPSLALPPGDVLRKPVNPGIGFDHQQRAGHSRMFLQPWQPKEPWLNVYKEKVPGVLHLTITLHPFFINLQNTWPEPTLTAAVTTSEDVLLHDPVWLIRPYC